MNVDGAMADYARGDAKAFAIVYDGVAPRLEGYLRKRVRDQARVEDLIQQTFLQMHTSRGSFIPGAEVLPWAFAIAKNLMIDWGRKTRREESRDLTDETDSYGRVLASGVADGEQIVQARETGERISARFDKLSEEQRDAVELRAGGSSCAEAASALKTTSRGVRLRIHRAMLALRAVLTDDGEPPGGLPPSPKDSP
jgi:RNA polymerase sigma-70 factor (ECF subfamily)